MKTNIAVIFAFVSFGALAAPLDFRIVPYKGPSLDRAAYLAITEMSAGPWLFYDNVPEEAPENTARGERWRVVVVPPSEEGSTDIVLEKITIGPEGCCLRLQGRWQLNATQDMAQFRIVEWRSPTEFVFALGNERFSISGLNTKTPTVTPHEH